MAKFLATLGKYSPLMVLVLFIVVLAFVQRSTNGGVKGLFSKAGGTASNVPSAQPGIAATV